jgi:signal transduction histidine kinase
LLRDLFDPLEVQQVPRAAPRARVLADGSALVVPVRGGSSGGDDAEALSLVLRFARRGRRIFTREDARLADRIVEQLRRAVAYDRAVERGRSEERLRIAQDLHDDIGARLLTLMYKSSDPEIEDYIRHTLQDLKTLTRGLAASHHRLSHSIAEWKADIQQRLTAAHVELAWSYSFDQDLELSVVQWSGLTRVLRELVSNAIYHARATRLEIEASLEGPTLNLRVADDGIGRDPKSWSHGLGLGGVRKRVKQLGGEVVWRENGAQGIVCEVRIPDLLRRDT